MFAQVTGEGNQHVLLQDIVDHRYNGTEVKEQDAFITTRTGIKRRRENTKGLKLSSNVRMGEKHW